MFWSVTLSLLEGLREVVNLFALTLVFSLPLGLAVTFGSMSKWAPFRALAYRQQEARGFARWLSQLRPLSALTNVIVWVIRGTPLILQLSSFSTVPAPGSAQIRGTPSGTDA